MTWLPRLSKKEVKYAENLILLCLVGLCWGYTLYGASIVCEEYLEKLELNRFAPEILVDAVSGQ